MESESPDLLYKTFDTKVITDDVRKIAEAELHETDDQLQTCLDTLKDSLKKEKGLTPCLEDDFLIMFLRARKFDSQATLNLIKSYYTAHVTYPNMFGNFTPKSCMTAINANLHYFLPYRSSDGSAILLSKFGTWDPRTLTCEELLKFNIMCNEMAIKNPVTQICGITTIADMKDFSWSHMMQIQVSDLRCFVSTLQDCLPIRQKAIHIIHHSSIFSILFSLVKPLLSVKVRNRIYFHGDDLNSLHQHIPPEVLPESLGGKLRDRPNEEFYNSLLNSEEDFIMRHHYGYLSQNQSP